MILHSLGLINKKQRGFTLIELIIALTLAVIIVAAGTMIFMQMMNGSARSNNRMTAVGEVQNAGQWVSKDVQTAQFVEPAPDDPDGFPLTLEWTDQLVGNDTHTIVYTIVGNELRRSYSVNGGEPTEFIVAEFIDSGTYCAFSGLELVFNVTATVGKGLQVATETREYRIIHRPN